VGVWWLLVDSEAVLICSGGFWWSFVETWWVLVGLVVFGRVLVCPGRVLLGSGWVLVGFWWGSCGVLMSFGWFS
jgi:hypothetical protein